MQVHLVDGTYELFRQFLAPRPGHRDADGIEVGATRAVLGSILGMLEGGATHLGVATDHVIPSFRNDLWADYKTGEGIDPELFAQFQMLEDALEAMGVAVWPMVELEADDALASARAGRRRGSARRAGDHLHARQGSRAVRRRQGRAARPAQGDPPRRRRRAREVRRVARSRSPTSSRSWATAPTASPAFPASARSRRPRCCSATSTSRRSPTTAARGTFPGCAASTGSRRRSPPAARSRTLLQGARDAAHRRRRRHRRRLALDRTRPTQFGDWCDRLDAPRLLEPRAGARQHEEIVVTDAVLVEDLGDGITQITLNRPERLNAMNYALDLRAARRARRARRRSRRAA